jgi:serine/threonine protein kinase
MHSSRKTGSTRVDPGPMPRSRNELPRIPGHEVLSVLGPGGMVVVFKARHLRLNRPVAVKMLLAGGYAGPHELAGFRREAESLAELGHANVEQIYEAGDLDGLPFFTMELVEGRDPRREPGGHTAPATPPSESRGGV